MTYMILQRFENGPMDLLRVDPSPNYNSLVYIIRDVLIHNDKRMIYEYDKERDIYGWSCGENSPFYIILKDDIKKERLDKIVFFDDDDSAKLYFEVMSNELA